MQDDSIEVSFCDLCGTSVPETDFVSGAALRHQGKTIGACCLGPIRGASPGVGVIGGHEAALAPGGVAKGNSLEARLLPIAVVLLAAIAAATIYLDHKVTGVDQQWRTSHDQLLDRHRSESDMLQTIDQATDGVAHKADIETVVTKVGTESARLETLIGELQRRVDSNRGELEGLHTELRAIGGTAVDYRPMFEDLRQRQLRMQEVVDSLRAAPPAAAPTPAPVVPIDKPPAADANALPPALADQVVKLAATDPATRFEAVDELLRSKNPAVLASLLPLARDPDGFVRRLTVEGLRDFKRPEAVEALLTALQDDDKSVADTAWRSLRELTGQKLPFEATASRDAKARAIQKWTDWWDKNKATFGA